MKKAPDKQAGLGREGATSGRVVVGGGRLGAALGFHQQSLGLLLTSVHRQTTYIDIRVTILALNTAMVMVTVFVFGIVHKDYQKSQHVAGHSYKSSRCCQ